MNSIATWLTIAACVLLALVPVGGLSLCFGDGLCDVDVGASTGCPCGGHEDVPVDEHFDLSVDSIDGLRSESEPEPDPTGWAELATTDETEPAAAWPVPPVHHGSAPPPVETGAIRERRTIVLLI